MSTSLDSPLPSHYRSRQAFLASLPPWRRLLAKLNWHPTIDKKVERYRLKQKAIERERQILQIEKETEQLRRENARLAELNARIAALWPNANSSSTQAPRPESDLPT
jgi:hypothetical protein